MMGLGDVLFTYSIKEGGGQNGKMNIQEDARREEPATQNYPLTLKFQKVFLWEKVIKLVASQSQV